MSAPHASTSSGGSSKRARPARCLVTGITGFVGAHVALTLLQRERGILSAPASASAPGRDADADTEAVDWSAPPTVRGTARSARKLAALEARPEFAPYVAQGRLQSVAVGDLARSSASRAGYDDDDTEDAEYDAALADVDVVIHVASPFHSDALAAADDEAAQARGLQTAEQAFLQPALQGVRRVFRAALHTHATRARPGVRHFVMTSSDAAVFEADDVWTNGKVYDESVRVRHQETKPVC